MIFMTLFFLLAKILTCGSVHERFERFFFRVNFIFFSRWFFHAIRAIRKSGKSRFRQQGIGKAQNKNLDFQLRIVKIPATQNLIQEGFSNEQ